jgi:hypothetical protein
MRSAEAVWCLMGWFMMTSSTTREVKHEVRRSTKKEAKPFVVGSSSRRENRSNSGFMM